MAKLTVEDLKRMKNSIPGGKKNWIRVGYSTCGIAAGAEDVVTILLEEIKKRNLDIEVKKCGCVGMCYAEPLVEVSVEGLPRVFYGKVDKETAARIVEKHLIGKMLLNDRIYNVKLDSLKIQG